MPTKARNETRKIGENSLGAQRCEGIRTKQLFHIERRLLLFVDYVAVLDMLRAMMWCPHGSEAPQKPTALLRAQALSYIINNENTSDPPPTIYGVFEVQQRGKRTTNIVEKPKLDNKIYQQKSKRFSLENSGQFSH